MRPGSLPVEKTQRQTLQMLIQAVAQTQPQALSRLRRKNTMSP